MKTLFTLFSCLLFTLLEAQVNIKGGSISGRVLDRANKIPIEFSTVSLHKLPDSTLLGGVITDEKGAFKFENIKSGNYFVKVSFMGYVSIRSAGVTLPDDNSSVNIGTIFLNSDKTLLKEVEVEAEKSQFQLTLDKKIFNVDKALNAAGGNATDVLKNVPTVNVDTDGNLSLRGSDDIQIFIDGKASSLLTSNPALGLQQIPASSIEKVELITNPSAKYDASGTVGIINIVLKKDSRQGFNGSISAGIGSNNKYNASGLFNFQKGKFNVFLNYSYRYNQREGYGSGYSDFTQPDTSFYIDQLSNSLSKSDNQLIKSGIDYNINKSTSLSLSGSMNQTDPNNSNETTEYSYYDEAHIASSYRARSTATNSNNLNYEGALNFRKKFESKKQELTADLSYSEHSENSNSTFTDRYFFSDKTENGVAALQRVNQPGNNRITIAQSDYSGYIGEKVQFETGLKFSQRYIASGFEVFDFNYSTNDYAQDHQRDNKINYTENIAAAYLSGSRDLGKGYKVKMGVRAEQTFILLNQLTLGSNYQNDYLSFFPTAAFSKKINEKTDVQFSYSRRISRPNPHALNPIADISDPLNIRMGNPYLKPMYIDATELNMSKYIGKIFFLATVYNRITHNQITRFKTIDSTGAGTVKFENLKTNFSSGLEVTAKYPIAKWWNVNGNINIFQTQQDGSNLQSGLTQIYWGFSTKLSTDIKIKKTFTIQVSGFYNTPSKVLLGYFYGFRGMDIGIKKEFMKGKLTTSLNLTDVFDTQQFRIVLDTPTFGQEFIRKRETRILTFSINWFLGKSENVKKQKAQQENQDRSAPVPDIY